MELFLLIPILIFIIALFIPVLRKTLGVLFIILGTLATLTFIGAIIGIPMIIGGGILLFIGDGNPQEINIVNNVPAKDDEGRIECPFCAELIKPNAKICRYCHKELPIKINIVKKVVCPYCQTEFKDDSEICPHCKKIVCECENCGAILKDEATECESCGTRFS